MEKQKLDFNVFIEQDEDGIYVGKVPELDGCFTQGKTVEEVMDRIREAIEVCLEADDEEINPARFIDVRSVSIEKSPIV